MELIILNQEDSGFRQRKRNSKNMQKQGKQLTKQSEISEKSMSCLVKFKARNKEVGK